MFRVIASTLASGEKPHQAWCDRKQDSHAE